MRDDSQVLRREPADGSDVGPRSACWPVRGHWATPRGRFLDRLADRPDVRTRAARTHPNPTPVSFSDSAHSRAARRSIQRLRKHPCNSWRAAGFPWTRRTVIRPACRLRRRRRIKVGQCPLPRRLRHQSERRSCISHAFRFGWPPPIPLPTMSVLAQPGCDAMLRSAQPFCSARRCSSSAKISVASLLCP